MKSYLQLLRPKDWAKNLFVFIPSFFAGSFFQFQKIELLIKGFFTFCFFASSIYIINDYRDIEKDRIHPEKRKRPLVTGKVKKAPALILFAALLITGIFLGYSTDHSLKLLFILSIYFALNLFYSFGFKNIAILDILILASGFVLRIKAGAVITDVDASQWLIIMTFLLALFLSIAKRRDDLLLTASTGNEMRKSMRGYNLDFLNTMMSIFGAIIIVSYIMYTVDGPTLMRLGTHRLYYTSLFVIAGIMRYLQITFIEQKSGSPTEILFKDRFVQITIVLWVICFVFILYIKNIVFFKP